MKTDVERAFLALDAKASVYGRLFAYFDGDQPVVYTAKRLEEFFRDVDACFVENWCAVVVDSVRDRINLRGAQTSDPQVQAVLSELMEQNDILLESDDVHEAALVAGEAFFIVWPGAEGVEAYYNDPRMCHIFYEADNPRRKRMACKWWIDEEEGTRLTLYYADRLEYYRHASAQPSSAAGFEALGSAANPYGAIPVFHFRATRRVVKSDLKDVIPVQNGINKLLADMMVAAEYGAFKQRFVIGNGEIQGQLRNAPNEIWWLPGGDGVGQQTQAGEFAATDLDNYLKAIDNLATAISSITRTPKHYFFSVGSNLSGDALIAMEAPLNKKAQDRIDRFAPVWREVCGFMLRLVGVETPADLTPLFDRPEMMQPRTQAEVTQLRVAAGVPLKTALRWEGRSQAEIVQMQADGQEALEAGQTSLARALLQAERQFNAGGMVQSEGRGWENG